MLLDGMEDKADGIAFCDPITEEDLRRIIDGFVHDMTLWQGMFQWIESMEELIVRLQQATQW